MEQSAYSQYFALKLLWDSGLVTESNIQKVSDDMPLQSSGYILSSDFEAFKRQLENG
jgi:hypothetical protein